MELRDLKVLMAASLLKKIKTDYLNGTTPSPTDREIKVALNTADRIWEIACERKD